MKETFGIKEHAKIECYITATLAALDHDLTPSAVRKIADRYGVPRRKLDGGGHANWYLQDALEKAILGRRRAGWEKGRKRGSRPRKEGL